MATAGEKLQRCRVAFLGEIPVPRKILIAGEGHGRFLPICAELFPDAVILVVDYSAKMLEFAGSKVKSDRIEFVHADFLEWVGPSDEFDLIVTNFFLDCFREEELAVVVRKLGDMAAPQADWLLADFEFAPVGLARWRSKVIVGLLYRFFRIVTGLRAKALIPPEPYLREVGFILNRRKTHEWGLLKSEWWRRG